MNDNKQNRVKVGPAAASATDDENKADPGQQKNIVVIGDGAVGKTSLLFAYINESLVTNYVPTMYVFGTSLSQVLLG